MSENVGMCNCGHFEHDYEKHTGCPECGKPWRVMHYKQAMLYLHTLLEEETKQRREWRDKYQDATLTPNR